MFKTTIRSIYNISTQVYNAQSYVIDLTYYNTQTYYSQQLNAIVRVSGKYAENKINIKLLSAKLSSLGNILRSC